MNEREIFDAAVAIGDLKLQAEFLAVVCAGDEARRERLLELLDAQRRLGSFLESPPHPGIMSGVDSEATRERAPQASQSDQIGPYKLLQPIGEGGMGSVWLAEQLEPVRRRVALKLIKPGMDSRQVLARFEAERQALSMMDHPNIARVLDAGTTDHGRPYFVMELVKGQPITQYCDEHHLTPRERLELFLPLCHAIQHAHQKGIIHRDIKPSNVLVAEYDSRPVAKVIDFGVAKAVHQPLTDRTMFTGLGQIVGTLEYMSPEQAKVNQLDIDTRSDVYSLGVLLYELLAGSTPFDKKRMREAALDELLRIIREEEPPRPSTRLSTSETLPNIAANRKTEPARLSTLIRGELDWIVMKALEKDRNRRYETANGFAMDIQRYLNDEAVLACPPSTAYRFRKFSSKNKTLLATIALVSFALILGLLGTTWQSFRATRAEKLAQENERKAFSERDDKELARQAALESAAREAEQRQIAEDAQTIAEQARDQERSLRQEAEFQRDRANQNANLARRAVDEYLSKVVDAELLSVPGMQPLRQDLLAAALKFYDEFSQERSNDPAFQADLARAQYRLSTILRELGDGRKSQDSLGQAISMLESLRERGHADANLLALLADSYFFTGRYDDTIQLCETILADDPQHVEARGTLGEAYNTLANNQREEDRKSIDKALELHQKALAIRQQLVEEFPNRAEFLAGLSATINNIGTLLGSQNKPQEALEMYKLSISYKERALELTPYSILWARWYGTSCRNAGYAHRILGQNEPALEMFERQAATRKRLVYQNPAVSSLRAELYEALLTLADQQKLMKLTVDSNRSYRDALDVLTQIPRDTPEEKFQLAVVYASLAERDPSLPETAESPDAADERLRNADLAMAALQDAFDAGWSDDKALVSYKMLDPLREREEFKVLAEQVAAIAEANRLLATQPDTEEARLADRQKAAEILDKLAADHPEQVRVRRGHAIILHALGTVQMGLEQFELAEANLRRSLDIRRALAVQFPDDKQHTLQSLSTQVVLGELFYRQGSYDKAHHTWQNCQTALAEIEKKNGDDRAIVRSTYDLRRTIVHHYALLGIIPPVQKFIEDNVHSKQVHAIDTGAYVTDGEFSTAVLLLNDKSLKNEFFAQLQAAILAQPDQIPTFEATHFVRGASLLEDFAIEQPIVDSVYQTWSSDPSRGWVAIGMAIREYRRGKYQDASKTLLSLRTSNLPQQAFLDAAIAAKLGNLELARQRWLAAETRYQTECERALVKIPRPGKEGVWASHWWQSLYGTLMRQLAAEALAEHGEIVPPDPWLDLIEWRGYRLIGEDVLAQAAFERAVALAGDDPALWLAVTRVEADSERVADRVKKAWDAAVERAPMEALPLIQRARWLEEHGQRELAEADFQRAMELTPHELNQFLQAGWWVAGPYPKELLETCPPEVAADPALPIQVIDPQVGWTGQAIRWQTASVGETHPGALNGVVRLNQLPDYKPGGSYYALAYVYSPVERCVTLFTERAWPIRAWVNGQATQTASADTVGWLSWQRTPISLRAGKNAILIKTHHPAFVAFLDDNPIALAWEQFNFGAYRSAVESFAKVMQRSSDDHQTRYACWSALMAGDMEQYRDWYQQLESYRNPETDIVLGILHAESFVGLDLDEVERARLQRILDRWYADGKHVNEQWMNRVAAYTHCRLGQYDRVIEVMERFPHEEYAWPALAIAYHRLGREDEAKNCLQRASDFCNRLMRDIGLPGDRPLWLIVPFYREALLEIHGNTQEFDQMWAALVDERERLWQEQDPRIAAYDRVVFNAPQDPHPYLARGRRWVELGDMDKAERDFNRAVDLAPTDPWPIICRLQFRHEKGDLAAAVEDLKRYLQNGFPPTDYPTQGLHAESLIAGLAAVSDSLLRELPGNSVLHRYQGHRLIMQGDWIAARQAFSTGDPSWLHAVAAAALSILLDDHAGHQAAMPSPAVVTRPQDFNQVYQFFTTEWVNLLVSRSADELEKIVQRANAAFGSANPVHKSALMGLIHYRAGEYQLALDSLAQAQAINHRGGSLRTWPVQAMAHWKLENPAEARRFLEISHLFIAHEVAVYRKLGRLGGAQREMLFLPCWLALHREARALIDGADAAEREILTLFHGNADVVTVHEPMDTAGRVIETLNVAVETRGANAPPWLERGQWYLEQGEFERAAEDYREAASRMPAGLHPFLESSWWLAGPFPLGMAHPWPLEFAANPARGLFGDDPTSRFAELPQRWQRVRPGSDGGLLASSLSANPRELTWYWLNYVYSPNDRTATLVLDITPRIQIRVNDDPLIDLLSGQPRPFGDDVRDERRIPVTLRTGMNAILIKADAPQLKIRLADTLNDQALRMAKQHRFSEVTPLLSPSGQATRLDPWEPRFNYVLAANLGDRYWQDWQTAWLRTSEDERATYHLVRMAAYMPISLADELKPTVIRELERASVSPTGWWIRQELALLNARLGRFDRARQLLDHGDTYEPRKLLIRTFLAQVEGKTEEAGELWEQVVAEFIAIRDSIKARPRWERSRLDVWYQWAQTIVLLREVERRVTGFVEVSNQLINQIDQANREIWQTDVDLVDYDFAVRRHDPMSRQQEEPELYVWRATRLEQLGRSNEALADLNRIFDMAEDKRGILERRGAFHIRQGNFPQAVTDLDAAMQLWLEQKPFNRRFPQIGQSFLMTATTNDEVYQLLAQKYPDFDSLHTARAWWLCRRSDWKSLQRMVDESGFGLASLLLPDGMATHPGRFAEWLEGERVAASATLNVEALAYGIWLVMAPNPLDSAAEITRISQFLRANPSELYNRFVFAMALYRKDQFEAALEELQSLQTASAAGVYPWRYHPSAMFLEAMIQFRLGNVAQATRIYCSAESILTTVQNLPDDQVPLAMTSVPAPGDYWLVGELLYREAKKSLEP